MPQWRIPVSWEMSSVVSVEARTLEEAMERAYEDDIPLPDDGEYVDGSWRTWEDDIDEVRAWYNDGQPDEPEETAAGEDTPQEQTASNEFRFEYNPSGAWSCDLNEEEEEERDPDEMFGFLLG